MSAPVFQSSSTPGASPYHSKRTEPPHRAGPPGGDPSSGPTAAPEIDIAALARRVMDGGEITRDEARTLFSLEGEAIWDLFYWAHKIRSHFHGNRVTFCSIVASKFGNCSENCQFCAQSVHHNTNISARPMMGAEEVVHVMRESHEHGASAFGIVNQGRGPAQHDWHLVLDAVRRMKEVEGTCRCASLGILTEKEARDLKEAGLLRYNHNLESSREFYSNVCTTHTWEERYETVKLVKRLGIETCCGGIFGMGESIEDRVSLAFSLKELNPNVVPLNFLYSVPGTPMENVVPLPPLEILKIIAVFRFILPHQDIKVAGGRERNLRDLQSWIFYAGATSALVGNYLATFGRPYEEDLQMIRDLGLEWVPRAGGPRSEPDNVLNPYEKENWNPMDHFTRAAAHTPTKEYLHSLQREGNTSAAGRSPHPPTPPSTTSDDRAHPAGGLHRIRLPVVQP